MEAVEEINGKETPSMSEQSNDAAGTSGERSGGEDAIARRAYEISQSEEAGTPEENWQRAEHQLRGEPGADPSPT